MKSLRGCSWLVVPRKIRKKSPMSFFQKKVAQKSVFWMVSSWQPMTRLTKNWMTLVPIIVHMSWIKCLSLMVLSNMLIVRRLVAPGG